MAENDIACSGENNNKLKAALNNLKHKIIVGKIITHADYEDTKEELLANCNALGYLQAEFKESILAVDRNNYVANIKLKINGVGT